MFTLFTNHVRQDKVFGPLKNFDSNTEDNEVGIFYFATRILKFTDYFTRQDKQDSSCVATTHRVKSSLTRQFSKKGK